MEWTQDMLKFIYPASGYDADRGVGDVCRYISDRGWVEGRWRMPTLDEVYLLQRTLSNTPVEGAWELQGVSNYPSGTYGTAQMINGQWIGSGPTGTKARPGDYSLFFPASGDRWCNKATGVTAGMMQRHGILGHYWAASCQKSQASGLSIHEDKVSNYGSDRAMGHSVRCIRDWEYENELNP